MSDFVYSSVRKSEGELSRHIRSIWQKDDVEVSEFHGAWGSLAVSEDVYSGFKVIDNDEFIFFVLGGPVLNFRDNCFLTNNTSFEGVESLFKKFVSSKIVYHEDLSGPFILFYVDKIERKIGYVTDLMLFAPVYNYVVNNELFVSSHIDIISRAAFRAQSFDYVSLVDFVINDVVTFPYTSYIDIFQSEPASIYEYKILFGIIESSVKSNYWAPSEARIYDNIDHAAAELKYSVQDYVARVTEKMDNVAHFLSGGEDSRVIAGILPARLRRDGFLFLDSMNREGLISSKVADAYGVNLHVHIRSKTYYIDILHQASRLIGLGHQYLHAHSLGMCSEFGLDRYPAVFGGYLSDSLLKGIYTLKVRRVSRMHFVPQFFLSGERRTGEVRHPSFNADLLQEVTQRRRRHFARVSALRPQTAHEWFTLWPATMRSTIPNILASRRLFRSYEPFLGNGVVKVSAGVPIEWKLNRRLFNKAFSSFLYNSRHIMHGDGFFPYYPWWLNIVLRQGVSWGRKISRKAGLIKGNQGAWTDWKKLVNSEAWANIYHEHVDRLKIIETCLNNHDVSKFDYNSLTVDQKMNLLQILASV